MRIFVVLSARHSDRAFDFISAVAQHRAGLILLSDDRLALEEWQRGSAEDLYVELTPESEMQELVIFGRRAGLPPVATCRAKFLTPVIIRPTGCCGRLRRTRPSLDSVPINAMRRLIGSCRNLP